MKPRHHSKSCSRLLRHMGAFGKGRTRSVADTALSTQCICKLNKFESSECKTAHLHNARPMTVSAFATMRSCEHVALWSTCPQARTRCKSSDLGFLHGRAERDNSSTHSRIMPDNLLRLLLLTFAVASLLEATLFLQDAASLCSCITRRAAVAIARLYYAQLNH